MGVPEDQLHAAARAEHGLGDRDGASAVAGADGNYGATDGPGAADSAVVLVPVHLWDAVRMFESLCTQWRVVSGMAGLQYIGLDYNTLDTTMRWLGLAADTNLPRLLQQLQTMERCGLRVLNGVADGDDDVGDTTAVGSGINL